MTKLSAVAVFLFAVSCYGAMAEEYAQSQSCAPKKTCSKIHSCDEAVWYLNSCPWGGALDRDGDGAPCETLCGSNN